MVGKADARDGSARAAVVAMAPLEPEDCGRLEETGKMNAPEPRARPGQPPIGQSEDAVAPEILDGVLSRMDAGALTGAEAIRSV